MQQVLWKDWEDNKYEERKVDNFLDDLLKERKYNVKTRNEVLKTIKIIDNNI